jgi:hypothetical protein
LLRICCFLIWHYKTQCHIIHMQVIHCAYLLLFPLGNFLEAEFLYPGQIFQTFTINIPNCPPELYLFTLCYSTASSASQHSALKCINIWWFCGKIDITLTPFAFFLLLETVLVIFISHWHIFYCQLSILP